MVHFRDVCTAIVKFALRVKYAHKEDLKYDNNNMETLIHEMWLSNHPSRFVVIECWQSCTRATIP